MTTRIVVLTGGVGGAKLVDGLARMSPAVEMTVVVNTGDDFEHCGVYVCPDIDTTLYTLAGLAHPVQGWGRHDETWNCQHTLEELGQDAWFRLGDRDLALHLARTSCLRQGQRLTEVTLDIARRLGVTPRVLPATDQSVRTVILSDIGELAFQEYFVRKRCQPRVQAIEYRGADRARLSAEVVAALEAPDLDGIVLAPSNPYLSIGPILAIPSMRDRVTSSRAPVVAVSPIIAGRVLKGPTAKIMDELGVEVSAASVARLYGDLIDVWLVDPADVDAVSAVGVHAIAHDVLMETAEHRRSVASAALDALSRPVPSRGR